MNRARLGYLFSGLLLLVLVAAGCGGDSVPSSSGGTTPTLPESTATAEALPDDISAILAQVAELRGLEAPPNLRALVIERDDLQNDVVDTLALARKKYPGGQASLDALCRRFNIDNSARTKHGALLDVELLAEVYLELIGGRQPGLTLEARASAETISEAPKSERPARDHAPTAEELVAHEAFLDSMDKPIWRR